MSLGRAVQDLRRDLDTRVGAVIVTVLQWIPESRTLRRVSTSHPEEYPVGAEKRFEVSAGWTRVVIDDRRTFLAATADELAQVFSDTDLIRSLGCGAVINAPIVADDRVVAVLAILDREGRYDSSTVAEVERIVADRGPDLARAIGAPTSPPSS